MGVCPLDWSADRSFFVVLPRELCINHYTLVSGLVSLVVSLVGYDRVSLLPGG